MQFNVNASMILLHYIRDGGGDLIICIRYKIWSSFDFCWKWMFSKWNKCLQIKKPIIYGKEALLLSDLLEDIKRPCEKNGIEEYIITIARTLKRKIIDTFPEEISFCTNGKYLTVHSNDVNLCHYLLAVLKNFLKVLKGCLR